VSEDAGGKGTRLFGSPKDASPTQAVDSVELAQAVEDALARFGAAGSVECVQGILRLDGPRGQASLNITTWLSRFAQMDEATRRARAQAWARELLRKLPQPEMPKDGAAAPFWVRTPYLVPAAALLVVGIALAFTVQALSSKAETQDPVARSPAQQESGTETREERDERVCDATAARVARGAAVSIADVDGWVVELWLLRAGANAELQRDRLAEFLGPKSREGLRPLLWPEITAGRSGGVRVVDATWPGPTRSADTLTLTFDGAIVDPYFDRERRNAYYHFATSAADALGASHAALYARCRHRTTHYLGSWFRGPSAGDAAAALLFSIGVFAEIPHISAPELRPAGAAELDAGFAWLHITTATSGLTRAALAGPLGRNQGMAMGRDGEPVVIGFEFQDSSAASRASKALARQLSLGGW
jgi:hypothetical protein